MRNKELSTLVEIDVRLNQMRNILLSLTDDEKSSYLDILKQLDKKSVDYLINEKHMNPYSVEMLEQLEVLMKRRANLDLDHQKENRQLLEEEITAQRINRQNEEQKDRTQNTEMNERAVYP